MPPTPEAPSFGESLALELKLTIAGTVVTVPGAQIKHVSFDLTAWGFDAEVDFWLSEEREAEGVLDELYTPFKGKDLIEVELKVKSAFAPDPPPDPIILKGIVREKRLHERVLTDSRQEVTSRPVLLRQYGIRFQDPMQALWRQHFPCALFVDSTMQAILDAHKGQKITLAYDWDKLTAQRPILFLGLGDERNEASFYDLLVWFVHERYGVLTYDSQVTSYKIAGVKEAVSQTLKVDWEDVARMDVVFPETSRAAVRVLNSYTEVPKNQEIANAQAVTGIRRDILHRTQVAAHFTARTTLETAKLKHAEPEVHLAFKRIPHTTFRTGKAVDFTSDEWSADLYAKEKKYRVREVRFRAGAEVEEATAAPGPAQAGYRCTLTAALEDSTDEVVRLPAFKRPFYPVPVEGKVVSEQGEAAQETYQIYTSSTTSVDQYKIAVLLFAASAETTVATDTAGSRKVVVDFDPNTMPGHFYFPYFKDARVLLAMGFETARIKRFLDWRPGGRLPMDGQGNHILLGKIGSEQKDRTSMSHVYEDAKPVLTVKRILENDTEMLQLKEGTIIIQTKEEEA